ncbi:MAG: hypothetical protein ACE5EI_00460 [Thermodesulfobacteriota bacterium]
MIGRLSNRGSINFRLVFWVLVLSAVIYGGYKFGPPAIHHYMLKTAVNNEAKVAHMYTSDKLADRIMKKARTWSVPLERDGLVVEKWRDSVHIKVSYAVHLDFFGRYSKTLEYRIEVTRPLKTGSRVLY